MADLSELLQTRAALADKRDQLNSTRTSLQDAEARLAVMSSHRDAHSPDTPEGIGLQMTVSVMQVDRDVLAEQARNQQQEIDALAASHAALLAEEDALFRAADSQPVSLFPVRMETRFVEPAGGGGVDLLLRVYPDDLHVPAEAKKQGARVR